MCGCGERSGRPGNLCGDASGRSGGGVCGREWDLERLPGWGELEEEVDASHEPAQLAVTGGWSDPARTSSAPKLPTLAPALTSQPKSGSGGFVTGTEPTLPQLERRAPLRLFATGATSEGLALAAPFLAACPPFFLLMGSFAVRRRTPPPPRRTPTTR